VAKTVRTQQDELVAVDAELGGARGEIEERVLKIGTGVVRKVYIPPIAIRLG
jgi:hypothetical protein